LAIKIEEEEEEVLLVCVMMERAAKEKGGPVGASAAAQARPGHKARLDAQSLLSSVNGQEICLFYGRLLLFPFSPRRRRRGGLVNFPFFFSLLPPLSSSIDYTAVNSCKVDANSLVVSVI
jgi:hypothetical protein